MKLKIHQNIDSISGRGGWNNSRNFGPPILKARVSVRVYVCVWEEGGGPKTPQQDPKGPQAPLAEPPNSGLWSPKGSPALCRSKNEGGHRPTEPSHVINNTIYIGSHIIIIFFIEYVHLSVYLFVHYYFGQHYNFANK